MQNSGVLFDVTKCVGCGSCTVACKLWNDLEYEGGNAHGYDAKLGAKPGPQFSIMTLPLSPIRKMCCVLPNINVCIA